MALGTFTPPPSGAAGSFDPRQHIGAPLIVVPREFRADFATRKFPTPKDVVICDIVDIMANTVHVSVIWGSAAIVDRLKGSVPAEGEQAQRLPVKIVGVTSAAGNPYTSIDPLEDQELALAAAWDAKFPTRIDDERAARGNEVREAANRYDNGGDQTGAPAAPQFQALGQQQAAPVQQQAAPVQQAAPSAMDDAAIQAAIDALA